MWHLPVIGFWKSGAWLKIWKGKRITAWFGKKARALLQKILEYDLSMNYLSMGKIVEWVHSSWTKKKGQSTVDRMVARTDGAATLRQNWPCRVLRCPIPHRDGTRRERRPRGSSLEATQGSGVWILSGDEEWLQQWFNLYGSESRGGRSENRAEVESQGQWARSLAPFIASGAARDEQPPAGSGALKPMVLEMERGKGRWQDGSHFWEGKGSGDSLLTDRRHVANLMWRRCCCRSQGWGRLGPGGLGRMVGWAVAVLSWNGAVVGSSKPGGQLGRRIWLCRLPTGLAWGKTNQEGFCELVQRRDLGPKTKKEEMGSRIGFWILIHEFGFKQKKFKYLKFKPRT
jgi:hypothetical protein